MTCFILLLSIQLVETSNASATINPRNKDFRFTFPEGMPGPTDQHTFLSPRVGECKKLNQLRGKGLLSVI